MFLGFIRTQPVLLDQVFDYTPEAAKARLELFDRFERYFDTATARRYGGDQRILDHPTNVNTPAFPARLHAHPVLQPPFFDASTATEHAFYMEFEFRKIWEAFTYFKFHWDVFRIPDERFVNSSTLNEQQRVQTTWGQLYSARLARDSRYLAADVDRIIRHMIDMYGTPGMTPLNLVMMNGLLRYTGTLFETFTEQITTPESLHRTLFPKEGLYIVRCIAVPFASENAEVIRPPSVTYLPVFARSPEMIGETRVKAAVQMREQAEKRRDEINKLLSANPTGPDSAALQEELRAINASLDTVKETLEYQKENLLREKKGATPWKAAALDAHIEKIESILETRADRGLEGVKTERLIATHVTDKGDTLQLVLEAVNRTKGNGPPFTYYVSDSTTTTSTDAESSGATPAEAITAAVKSLLEKSEYGRGTTSLYLDKKVQTIRVEAREDKMLMEALSNFATLGSLIAVAAAPFTGGASLAFLVPIGVVGAIPSAYNLIRRLDDSTFRWDMTTVADIVNILGAVAGLGSEVAAARGAASAAKLGQAATATRRILAIKNAFAITGLGAGGLGVMLMSVQFYEQLEALDSLPPGMRAARFLQIVGRAMIDVGIQAGGILADKARLRDVEKAVGSRPAFEGGEAAEGPRKKLAEGVGQKTVEALGGDAVTLLTETHTPPEVKALVERVGEPAARELVTGAGREGLDAIGSQGLSDLVNVAGEGGVKSLLKTLAAIPEAAGRSLKVAQEWAVKVLRLPESIVSRILELDAFRQLRELPAWMREQLATLKESVLQALFGCQSPCKIDQKKIKEALEKKRAEEQKGLPPKPVDESVAAPMKPPPDPIAELEAKARADYKEAKKKGYKGKFDEEGFVKNYKNGEYYDVDGGHWRVPDDRKKPPPPPFPVGTDTATILDSLTGPDSTSTFKQYYEMLIREKILIEEGGVRKPVDEAAVRKAVDKVRADLKLATKEVSVEDVRHALKQEFRERVVEAMFRDAEGKALDPKASHERMRQITEKLASADKGTLTEQWVEQTRKAAGSTDIAKQVSVKASEHGLDGDRRLDLVDGDTIHEVKSGEGPLKDEDLGEMKDHLKLVNKESTINIRGGEPRQVKKLKWEFTSPEGARANVEYILRQLELNPRLTVEVYNNAHQSKSFTGANRSELKAYLGVKK